MLAETRQPQTRLERSAVSFDYRGKAYLRFDALPESRPVSNYPQITRMLTEACRPSETRPAPLEQPRGAATTLRLWVARFIERRRMLREVNGFTDEMLRDLGMTRAEARAVARTPFWQDYA
ncbi:DUF1127 domain-containing protein [Hoeflea sp.]|uniref:DUF1127 domain-containing protein n=1 Tax=Hoeflea sp. TaxID=1940281 RepID=UPI003B51E508